jgi:8-oxo-dGTP pyrophosphatase MutT (NUDIX family)
MTTKSGDNPLIESAVLVPVYRDDAGEVQLVIVRRVDGGPHGGELAFPGGKYSPGDRTLRDTALRETHEEIGLNPDAVEILERLDTMDTMTTRFVITPFLARIVRPREWTRSESEIAEILEVPLKHFADPAIHDEEMRSFDELPAPIRIPFYRIADRELWGATYRILHPLLPRLFAKEWKI